MGQRERERGAPQGVVLDIGFGVGALVVHAAAHDVGREIELSPCGQPSNRVHAQVHPRRAGPLVAFAAVFDAVPTGEYDLWRDATTVACGVTVPDGAVANVAWPSAPAGDGYPGGDR
ncbi:MAG TPA: phospholipase [Actinomycetota bacterium]|jgi:hypothetical protein